MPRTRQAIESKILASIRAGGSDKVFSAKDFQHLGTPTAVRQALRRLVKKGALGRARRGLYFLPRPHSIIGTTGPDTMAVIRALMKGSSARWQVSGAYAANRLGLSEQVPAKTVILTDGVPRKVLLGKMTLEFRRAAPRYLLGAGRPSGLVFQALRHLGPENVTDSHIRHLRDKLEPATKRDLARMASDFPQWMQPLVARIATPAKFKP